MFGTKISTNIAAAFIFEYAIFDMMISRKSYLQITLFYSNIYTIYAFKSLFDNSGAARRDRGRRKEKKKERKAYHRMGYILVLLA